MSLFGTYIQESIGNAPDVTTAPEEVYHVDNFNLDEAAADIAFVCGAFLAEAESFDSLLGLQESCIPAVFNEAAGGKLEALKNKIKGIFDKVITFFTGLIEKFQTGVIDLVKKARGNATLKSDVQVYIWHKDKSLDNLEKTLNSLFDATKNKGFANIGDSDVTAANDAKDKIANLVAAVKADKSDKKTFAAGTSLDSAIREQENAAHFMIKFLKADIAQAKAIQKKFETIGKNADKLDTEHASKVAQYCSAIIASTSSAIGAYGFVTKEICKDTKKVMFAASAKKEKEEKAEEK